MPILWLLAACGVPAGPAAAPLVVGPTPQALHTSLLAPLLGGGGDPVVEAPLREDQCRELTTGGATRDACVTAELSCGETLVGHTRGGARRFDSDFYEAAFCMPRTTDHDGGDERIYRVRVGDGDHRVVVTLDTPCADLDLVAMLWDDETCPEPGASIPRCEATPRDGTARERVELVSDRAKTWLVIVEGKGADEGAFGLSVQCFDGLY